MSRPPSSPDDLAVFLDLDGTLLEIAAQPHLVRVPEWLGELLAATAIRLSGALALISGRPIAELDSLLHTPELAAAGIHGLERRGSDGVIRTADVASIPEWARRSLTEFAEANSDLLIEDKSHSLAVHFRQAPAKAERVHDKLATLCIELGATFKLQAGKMVYEIRPSGTDKGKALAAFMAEPPFAGRIPVFIGDDVTDEDGFDVVNALAGYSVRVGDATLETRASHSLPDVDAVHDWQDHLDCDAF